MSEERVRVSDDAVIQHVEVAKLIPNESNPNEMTGAEFDLLTESLEEDGILDVLTVVPLSDGQFKIVSGEHRWRSARVLGWETVPAVVLSGEKWKDDDFQNAAMVKMNVLHGNMSPDKFFRLWRDMNTRKKSDVIQKMMGFAKKESLEKLIGSYSDKMKKAGVPKKKIKEFEDATKEVETVEDLNNILHRIFRKAGDNLKSNFMVFTAKGGRYLYVICDDLLWKAVKEMTDHMEEFELNAQEVFSQLMENWKELPCFGGNKPKDGKGKK